MLSEVYEKLKELVDVREVEVAGQHKVPRHPVVLPKEGMAVLQVVLPEGPIAKMPHEELTGKALVPLQPVHILQEFRIADVVEVGIDVVEDVLDGLGADGAIAADVAVARLDIELDVRYSGSVLTSIVLLFHQEIELVEAVERRPVLLEVVVEGLSKP
jgi:hypothetical protein